MFTRRFHEFYNNVVVCSTVQSKHERSLDQRENKLKRKRKETAEKENSPASVTDGWMKPCKYILLIGLVVL
ncbi:TPA_asm: hypothetical protein [Terrapene box turtle adintovirus]|uniref:Uncharacterized protein n=1 Tax=Terrapene box turtle adintovirus TaxID=2597808 RepID=A0A5H3CUF1_9VIRU|nr:hypothetical protein QKK81_gp12 [Terrapene box turtle adintovirus]DAC80292.1 TPA_asm: hypothetical protein [Terrapene box turtle adintovirus]